MATRSRTLGQDLKAWAADQLQVDTNAPPEHVRAAYLRQVQHENGAPNLTAREALLILTGRTNAARPALALEAAEEALRREVDDFASRFFSLAIAERTAEWENLKARGQGFVRVDARLTALRPGIHIVLPPLDNDSQIGELVSAVGKLFVLRPAARAAARQALLNDANRQGSWHAWAEAAQMLRKNHKAIAVLEPDLIARLADARVLAKQKAQLNRKMQKAAPRAEAVGAAGKSYSWGWVAAAVLGCSMCLRLLGTGTSSPKTNFAPPPKPPDFILERINKDRVIRGDPDFLERMNKERVIRGEKRPELDAPERGFGKQNPP
jgi:hypothetical protein